MPSRRQIREGVIQYLYAEGPEGIPAQAEDAASLTLLLEPLRQKVVLARGRIMVHLQQGRAAIADALLPLATGLAELPAPARRELQALDDLVAAEQDFARHLDAIQRELHGNKSPAALESLLDDVRDANAAGTTALSRLESTVPEFPGPEKLRTEALAIASTLPPFRQRCKDALEDEPPAHPDFKGVRRALEAVSALRDGIEQRVEALAPHLTVLDERIAAAVENYSPERLDRVDRAILRLATHEILHDDDVPTPVAIDEAIELARRFGTTGSPAFVNGVLDRIRKAAASSQSEANL